MDETDRALDAVVIGGGQAGLAIGYHLAQQGRDFVILDERARVGDAWRTRWDSLRLFTPARYDGLPGMPFPGDGLAFPTKDELADYLEAYAERNALPIRLGVHVDGVRREDGVYTITAGDRRWTAERVIITTGAFHEPRTPDVAGELGPSIVQLHSAEYRNPGQLQPGPVLVVGLGNSGAEIALELSRTHPTSVSGTPSGELPVRHGRAAARFVLPVVRFAGLHVVTLGTPIGRRVIPKLSAHASPLIRTRRKELAGAGVASVGRVTGASNGLPVVDGRELAVANVIWCTGYRSDFGWLQVPAFDETGAFRQWRGVVASVPGLYVLGLDFMYSLNSESLPGTVRDAAYLARRIAAERRAAVARPRAAAVPASS
ncbi:FAD-dependent oxidoreductase [Agromyces mariniharenae]|uniref:FAD-dependent oxidoreductase n=2 Tax=Agromyces mariniharenae TaxID=2604423 RepID=A0A5S4VKB1_9MICO|nr:FAD-dependent oxidoreductase [Agromyces mariniharenae]